MFEPIVLGSEYGGPVAAPEPVSLEGLRTWKRSLAGSAATAEAPLSDAERIDLIRALEEVKASCAALQARLSVEFRDSQLALAEAALEDDPEVSRSGQVAARRRAEAVRSVCSQVALARRESPVAGNRHLGVAMALVGEMPHTFAALQTGKLSEWRATILVRETACLSRADRTEVDTRIGADTGRVEGWGNGRLAAEAKRIAAELDAESVVARARRAVSERRVSLRPAPATMSYLTALLPVAHGVAVLAALGRHADALRAAGDQRSRGAIMADTLVERITGRPAESPVQVELNLTMTVESLFDPGSEGGQEPAWLDGYGIVPADWAREHIAEACGDASTCVWARRIFTHPRSGQLLGMDSGARIAPAGLARLIRARDGSCRNPWCDAPVRHIDHVTARVGGRPDRGGEPARAVRDLQPRQASTRLGRSNPTLQTQQTSSPDHHTHRTPLRLHRPTPARDVRGVAAGAEACGHHLGHTGVNVAVG